MTGPQVEIVGGKFSFLSSSSKSYGYNIDGLPISNFAGLSMVLLFFMIVSFCGKETNCSLIFTSSKRSFGLFNWTNFLIKFSTKSLKKLSLRDLLDLSDLCSIESLTCNNACWILYFVTYKKLSLLTLWFFLAFLHKYESISAKLFCFTLSQYKLWSYELTSSTVYANIYLDLINSLVKSFSHS